MENGDASSQEGAPGEEITLSVVVPMYNEEAVLDHLFTELVSVLESTGESFEIVCVNDASRDGTMKSICAFHEKDPRIKAVSLSRNFGKEIALTAGLDFATGKAVIPIDADLQDPPDIIPDMIAKWREGYDVVYAVRRSREGESILKRLTSFVFYRIFNLMVDVPIPVDTGDFRLMDRVVVDHVKQLREKNRFMKGIFSWVGFKQIGIEFDRRDRHSGQSSWNYFSLWRFAFGGIASFSNVPLRVWSYGGVAISLFAFAYAAFLMIRTMIYGIDFPGYASLMVAILFMGGIQLISLGVIGEYLGRVFDEVKGRPMYVVSEVVGSLPEQRGSP